MRKRRLVTLVFLLPTLFLVSAYAGYVAAPVIPQNPTEVVNWGTLVLFLGTWAVFGYGAYWTVKKNRLTAEAQAAKQAKRFFLEELDDPAAKKKLADQRELWVHSDDGRRAMSAALSPLIDKAVDEAVKEHDAMQHAHALALTRYVSTDVFNGGMSRMEALIDGLRTLLAASQERQSEGIREVKQMIKESNDDRKSDFRDLKRNVAAALGNPAILTD